MKFENMKVKSIECGVRFKTHKKSWTTKNRKFHIVGVELNGISIHDFGFDTFTLKRNSLFFFNQKDDYSVDVKERGESLSVHFTTYEDIETDSFCINDGGTPEIIALLERIINQSAAMSENELKLTELLYRLCSSTQAARNKAYFQKDARLIGAKEYIERNYTENGCLENAAKLIGVTRRRFNDLFKNFFKITPNRYLIMLKIERARQLLTATDLSISEISEMCGFSDIYYFSKIFKIEMGQSPSDFRKQISYK